MRPAAPRGRVLCVDDEPFVLDGMRRALHGRYDLTIASSPDEALALMTETPDDFAVVVSDLKMPGMDGISLLSRIREVAPASVRILLTGHGDLKSVMDAVNRGSIFRFLTKPASRNELMDALAAGTEQHDVLVAERELLQLTLRGCVAALMETLSLANPAAFARTGRITPIVKALADALGADGWELEVAAMLTQIGAVTVSADVLAKLEAGQPLSPDERQAVDAVPEVSEHLLASIPRLEEVRRIIRYQNRRFDGADIDGGDEMRGHGLPKGSRILKLAQDLDELESRGIERAMAVRELRQREGCYDPRFVARLAEIVGAPTGAADVEVEDLQVGMVLYADVRDVDDVLLVPRGRTITESLLGVIRGYVKRGRVRGTVTVTVDPTGE